MYVYNITVKPDLLISAEWLQWMEAEQLPIIRSADMLEQVQVYKLLDHDDSDGVTYVMQCFIKTRTKCLEFIEQNGRLLIEIMHQKWRNRLAVFTTSMMKIM